jgi:hypothetical protein
MNKKNSTIDSTDYSNHQDAREVWLGCKYREMNEDGLTSPLDWLTDQYGHVLDAERELMDEMENPSTMLLSLRQSPIREDAGRREWIQPLRLRSQLNKPWKNVRTMLNRHLSEYPRHEYVRLTGYTDSAATPHYHVLVYVQDEDNSLSLEVGEAAIGSYVRGNEYASMEHHPVNEDESDAAVIEYDIPRGHDRVDESNYVDVLEHRNGESFKPSSEALLYLLCQRPEWCLAHIWDASSDVHHTSNMVDAAVISWATSFADFTSSDGFPYSSYDGGG